MMSKYKRTKKLIYTISFLVVLMGCSEKNKKKEVAEEKKSDKNVLFIVVDDLTMTLGTYGHPIVKTPNIDRLAKMGVQFNNAYCNFAVCNPSRSSLLTGLRPETTTITNNVKPLQSILGDKVTLPALFKQNGFYTMSLGKIFHTPEEKHNDLKAWDEILNFETTPLGKKGESRNITDGALKWCEWQATEGDDEDQRDGQIAQRASEFIRNKQEQPFFLAVGFHKPHDPFVAPKKYFDMYPIEELDVHNPPESWSPPYEHTLPKQTKVFNKFSEQDKKEFLRSYYACSSFMDAQVGKLLDALEESGQMDNTLIVFFGDHGYHLGEHNWWNKVTLFEQGTGAPFIVAGQSVGKKGVKSKSMFEFVDIYPTLAEVLGLKNVPNYLEGKSFANVIHNPSEPFRKEVRAIIRRGDMLGKSVKNKQWRYIEWDDGKQGVELYDQNSDPLEYDNLAQNHEYSDVVTEMATLLHHLDK
jgi:uncharacterized sulfatase